MGSNYSTNVLSINFRNAKTSCSMFDSMVAVLVNINGETTHIFGCRPFVNGSSCGIRLSRFLLAASQLFAQAYHLLGEDADLFFVV